MANSQDKLAFSTSNATDSLGPLVISKGFISPDVFSLFMEYTSYVMICAATFGLGGNVLILITYSKIGLSESINISYFSLGISDILCVLCLTWHGVCFIPAFADSNIPLISREFVVPTGGFTSDMFLKTTAWITAFISLERCLCVVFPLKIKTIVSRKRTVNIIVVIFVVTVLPLTSITFYTYVFIFKFDNKKNKSLIGVKYRKTHLSDSLTNFNYIYKLVFLNSIPFTIILVCAVVLAIQLNRSASWRLGKSSGTHNDDRKAQKKYAKDILVAKTVLAIALTSIVLGTLNNLRYFIAIFWPDFHPRGAYAKLFILVARLMFLLSFANSSINFIIYYRMGTKFRNTVKQLLVCKTLERLSCIVGTEEDNGGRPSI